MHHLESSIVRFPDFFLKQLLFFYQFQISCTLYQHLTLHLYRLQLIICNPPLIPAHVSHQFYAPQILPFQDHIKWSKSLLKTTCAKRKQKCKTSTFQCLPPINFLFFVCLHKHTAGKISIIAKPLIFCFYLWWYWGKYPSQQSPALSMPHLTSTTMFCDNSTQ